MKKIYLFIFLLALVLALGCDNANDTNPKLAPNEILHAGKIWTLFNHEAYTIVTNNTTALQLDLSQNALWFNSSTGGLIYRLIDGDFILSAHVNTVKKTNHTIAAECNACFGGLTARNPDGSNQNYVHIVTGVTPFGIGTETKSTRNNNSGDHVANANDPGWFTYLDSNVEHDLKLSRVGNVFSLYKKSYLDSDWILLTSYTRNDLPSTLQVGVNIYTSVNGVLADLSVIYENISIEQ